MPSYKIEMLGDGDRTLMDLAVKYAAECQYVCKVLLGPGEGRDIASEADYIVSNYHWDDEGYNRVTLTLFDHAAEGPMVRPDGSRDEQIVLVDDVWELGIY